MVNRRPVGQKQARIIVLEIILNTPERVTEGHVNPYFSKESKILMEERRETLS